MNSRISGLIGERDLHLALYLLKISPESSRKLVRALKKQHNKKMIKLSFEIKRVMCKCDILLVPGVTCTSKIEKEKDGTYLYKRCKLCEHSSKMRVNSKRF